ncbi:MAG: hypothetical protein COW08_03885 [Ignavibacteriales bacterium CG12_big_fil_rev_8_21_14_0_65_30_8]|nr:MAG: hypothetical protein COW08_03885 [Ignavibacteriales bacterium CG12_big_fil_rev_8_21_14_0_65_30_8]
MINRERAWKREDVIKILFVGVIVGFAGFGISYSSKSKYNKIQPNLNSNTLFCSHCGEKYSSDQAGDLCEHCGNKL